MTIDEPSAKQGTLGVALCYPANIALRSKGPHLAALCGA